METFTTAVECELKEDYICPTLIMLYSNQLNVCNMMLMFAIASGVFVFFLFVIFSPRGSRALKIAYSRGQIPP